VDIQIRFEKNTNMPHRYSEHKSDAYLRWRIKNTYAQIEPPREGKTRLMKAAREVSVQSNTKNGYINSMIEKEEYQDNNPYFAWLLASRLQVTFLSTTSLQ
jgi:hypothetical protein